MYSDILEMLGTCTYQVPSQSGAMTLAPFRSFSWRPFGRSQCISHRRSISTATPPALSAWRSRQHPCSALAFHIARYLPGAGWIVGHRTPNDHAFTTGFLRIQAAIAAAF